MLQVKFEDCRLAPRPAKAGEMSLKVGDVVEALMKQNDGDNIMGWQKAKIKELRVRFSFFSEIFLIIVLNSCIIFSVSYICMGIAFHSRQTSFIFGDFGL